jgi:Amt family ammonium transporter
LKPGIKTGPIYSLALILVLSLATLSWGETVPSTTSPLKVDTGDTAWVLISTALVMMMLLPGLALFYGGLVRGKNVLGTIMQSAIILCLVSLIWVFFGYSLAFGPDKGGFIGSFEWIGLSQVGMEPNANYGPTIPHQLFMLFQMMFAAITVALITGAFAERMRFSALLIFSILWVSLIYVPIAHWVWGGGWLAKLGALDFAGGAVVHISSAFGALATILVIGKRRGYGSEFMAPHNLPMVVLGAGLLWFGWFGFNAGSALGANETAVRAFLATHLAAAAAGVSWMTVEWIKTGKPTVLGAVSGMIAGLATVTPGAGFITILPATLIGLVAGIVCYFGVVWKSRLGYDDSLDVIGIHGVGGMTGILATGLFASSGAKGLFFGNPAQLGIQALTVVSVALFSFGGTWLILKLVQKMVRIRLTPEEESMGLDLSQHNERAYN